MPLELSLPFGFKIGTKTRTGEKNREILDQELKFLEETRGKTAVSRMQRVENAFPDIQIGDLEQKLISVQIAAQLVLTDLQINADLEVSQKSRLKEEAAKFYHQLSQTLAQESLQTNDLPTISQYIELAIFAAHEINNLFSGGKAPTDFGIRGAVLVHIHQMALLKSGD